VKIEGDGVLTLGRWGMKTLFLAVLLALVSGIGARATDVQFSYADFGQRAQALRPLFIYPLLVAATNSAGVTTRDRIAKLTAVNGSVTISNLMSGWVRAEFAGIWRVSTNWYQIPDTNVLVYARDCLQTNFLADGPFPVPAPWWGKSELLPGVNTGYRTNAGKVYIDSITNTPWTGRVCGGIAILPAGEATVTICTTNEYGGGSVFVCPFSVVTSWAVNDPGAAHIWSYAIDPTHFMVHTSVTNGGNMYFNWMAFEEYQGPAPDCAWP
jgi:hypothetical protein